MSRLQVPVFAMSARALSLYRSMQRRSGIALLGSAALLSAGFCLAAENALADRASASVAAVRGMALGPTCPSAMSATGWRRPAIANSRRWNGTTASTRSRPRPAMGAW